jgi:hypothetical protein
LKNKSNAAVTSKCEISGRPRCRWVGNITMELVNIKRDGVNWIGLAQDRDRWRTLVNEIMKLQVP